MKEIFVGYVNGLRYEDKEKFDKAVNDALIGGGNISVSSRRELVSDDYKEKVEPVSTPEGELVDLSVVSPDNILSETTNRYNLVKKLTSAANKEELKKEVDKYINSYKATISSAEENVKFWQEENDDYRKSIEDNNKSIDSENSTIYDCKKAIEKFESVRSIIEGNVSVPDRCSGTCRQKTVKSPFETFDDFLKLTGFWL